MKNQKTERTVQQNMLFNTVGSIIYYFCIWMTSVLIVRLSGYEDAGILSVAMTVTASPAIVGLFNVRAYQVSDIHGDFSDEAYRKSRIFTNALSFAICFLLTIVYGYMTDPGKFLAIFAYMILKMSEAGVDVYYGIYQKKARLDYAGISMTIRGVGALTIFIVTILATKNLILSILLMSLFSVAVVLFYDRRIALSMEDAPKEGQKADFATVKKLILICIPLAIVAFLNNLSLTVPRTYLEQFYGEEVMGYYASVSAPTIVIQLAANTMFAPLVPILTTRFEAKDKKGFLKILKLFGLLMLGLTAVAVVVSYFFTDFALQLVFGAEIAPYVYLFIPVLLSAMLIAINASLFSVCTLMRMIKQQYLVGVAGILMAIIMSFTVVKYYSMNGVIVALFVALLVQIIIQIGLIVAGMRKTFS